MRLQYPQRRQRGVRSFVDDPGRDQRPQDEDDRRTVTTASAIVLGNQGRGRVAVPGEFDLFVEVIAPGAGIDTAGGATIRGRGFALGVAARRA